MQEECLQKNVRIVINILNRRWGNKADVINERGAGNYNFVEFRGFR